MVADVQAKTGGVGSSSGSFPPFRIVVTELDALSNSVKGLVEAGDLDAAEAACRRLLEEYPDQVDGIWRLATVYEARGDRALAATRYRDAAEFMRSHDGFDEEIIADMMDSAAKMEAESGRRELITPGDPISQIV